jgi:hypothetical protein
MATYDKGDLVRSRAVFTDADGAKVDPTGVFVKYKLPDDNTITKEYGVDGEVVKDAVGVYHMDIDITQVGTWYHRWYGTGTGQAAEEEAFVVESTEF